MTAMTPAYAHAYRVICLTRQMPAVLSLRFRLPSAKARYPHLSIVRTTTRDGGNDFQDGTIYTDGSTRFAGRSAVTRSHHGRMVVLCGPVITTEAHLAFTGARTHSNNTAEMTAMIEGPVLSWPHGPVARDANSCFFHDSNHAAGICLGTVQARTRMYNLRLLGSRRCFMSSTGYVLPCNMCTVMQEMWEMSVQIMPLRWVPSAWFRAITYFSTRWTHHSFDSVSLFATCNNLGDVLEKLRDIRTELASTSQHQNRS